MLICGALASSQSQWLFFRVVQYIPHRRQITLTQLQVPLVELCLWLSHARFLLFSEARNSRFRAAWRSCQSTRYRRVALPGGAPPRFFFFSLTILGTFSFHLCTYKQVPREPQPELFKRVVSPCTDCATPCCACIHRVSSNASMLCWPANGGSSRYAIPGVTFQRQWRHHCSSNFELLETTQGLLIPKTIYQPMGSQLPFAKFVTGITLRLNVQLSTVKKLIMLTLFLELARG